MHTSTDYSQDYSQEHQPVNFMSICAVIQKKISIYPDEVKPNTSRWSNCKLLICKSFRWKTKGEPW